ncbi:MAG: XRE family transcriptional regulator [Deltaproteobacteria bacterium]|nr:XRE family transcriptional regulator [Deltaproteobacteria bacterium]
MAFPPKEELDEIRDILSRTEPDLIHDRNKLSKTDQLKYDLCEALIKYLNREKISQRELARILGIDPARISEITKYKFQQMSVDRLISYVEKVEPSLRISIAS